MRIKYLVVLLLFFISLGLLSKEKGPDAFKLELKLTKQRYNKEYNYKKAVVFFEQKQWDSTLIYSMKQLTQKNCPVELQNYCHYFRGSAFNRKKLFKQAKKELNSISKGFKFDYKVKINLAGINLELGNTNEALQYYREVEKKYVSKLNYLLSVTLYNNMGLCYINLRDYDNAEKYLFKNQQLVQTNNDTFALLYSYESLANLYYEQNKMNQAVSYFQKAYSLSDKVSDFNFKKTASGNMAVIEEDRNNFEQALKYRKEYEKWNDSIADQNAIWATADFEKKYEIGIHKKNIKLLKTENIVKVAQRNTYIAVSILFLLILLFGIFYLIQKIKSNKKTLQQKEELAELNATKDKLFSIVSHDLRSSINGVKRSNSKLIASLESKNYQELDQLLNNNVSIANSTYNLLDNLLNWSLLQIKQLYFHQEVLDLNTIINHVIYNFKPLLFDKKLQLHIEIPSESYVFSDLDSLKICLRNLLDNAIKFSNEKGQIHIYLVQSNDSYQHLVIEDNGIGIEESLRKELVQESFLLSKKANKESIGTGLGMQLTKSMIAKNGGKLEIESIMGNGTKMILLIPKPPINE
jgi:signal transduction histidine kinase